LQKNTRSANVASVRPLREAQRGLVGEPVRHVPQRARLRFQRLDHRRMTVPERGDRDTAREIDEHPPVLIPDARAFAAHREERRGCEALHHVPIEIANATPEATRHRLQ
jgi:hypothetical protein